jgi:hypothetical protein
MNSFPILIIPFRAASIQADRFPTKGKFNIAATISRTRIARAVRRSCGKSKTAHPSVDGPSRKGAPRISPCLSLQTLRALRLCVKPVSLIVAAQCVCLVRQHKSLDVIMHISQILLLGRSARGGCREKKGSHKTFSLAKSSYKVLVKPGGSSEAYFLADARSMCTSASGKSGRHFHAENRAEPPFPNKLKAGGVACTATHLRNSRSTWL